MRACGLLQDLQNICLGPCSEQHPRAYYWVLPAETEHLVFREVYQGMSKWVKTGELGPIITCIQTRCLTHLQSLRKQTCPELQKIVTRKLTSSTEKKKNALRFKINRDVFCIFGSWRPFLMLGQMKKECVKALFHICFERWHMPHYMRNRKCVVNSGWICCFTLP